MTSFSQETQEPEAQLPTVELLEFLGTFDDEESGWVDPMDLLKGDDKDFISSGTQEEQNGKH